MVITLAGPLGSGKTTLVRALLRARGVTGAIKSPTYALVEHYPVSSLYFYHIDLYRFTRSSEWETSGLGECFRDDSVCLVEWPERALDRLPTPDVELVLSYAEEGAGRRLRLVANTSRGERCERAARAAMTQRA
ncbi:MAG: tRNA (adenosine(37)-N6)-threonylcarbamoyltransferase complex ATPase subunit type 1 TsaE [Proteobacteria bacterium]|nr:tRNA (adenosine(37)-N6)-threonylcarbamoyltransferase complex ATPase subunit type 1 TsaE [Pseudomonadota bacterium]